MQIRVQNINNPDICNRSHARHLTGAEHSPNDVLIWDSKVGYVPLPVEGFNDWQRYINNYGLPVYIATSK
ncbi:MAG: hypothetical protein ACR2PH_11255 [Desulfobulbia bacterium]